MEIYKEFGFESAHFLPNVADTHKCKRMHGHSFRVRVIVEGPIDDHIGWVIDFADIKKIVDPIIERLDHRILNDIEGLENPTSEQIAIWLWQKIQPALPTLARVHVDETCTSGCIYSGN